MTLREREVRFLLDGAFYRLAYLEAGDPDNPPVVCVHGLTRQGRDFEPLMEALSSRFWLLAPDLPGRGRSEWLAKGALYQPASYVQALSHLLTAIDREVLWIGTSLGGICGMLIAAMPGQPITRLVLNDIGPYVPAAALDRIRDYMGALPESFPDVAALEAYLRRVYAPFGQLPDATWQRMAKFSARPLADGRVALHYDPRIAEPIRAEPARAIEMWDFWERIHIPVLVVRGEYSDLLLPDTLARVQAGGAKSVTVPNAGHAPALADSESIEAIARFLSG